MEKVLIVGPNLQLFGGVSFLLKSLKVNKLFLENDYFECGNKKIILGDIIDLIRFVKKIKGYKIIHLNPSFEYKSIIRDLLFATIGLFLNKKIILSWMGWNEDVENKFLKNKILRKVLLKVINNRLVFNIVSNKIFLNKLERFGCTNKIQVIYPPYDSYLNSFEFKPKMITYDKIRILFLARIENSKGIDKLIEIFELLDNCSTYNFTIAGDGIELKRIKNLVIEKKIDVNFTGFIKGDEKINLFRESDIFIFPSEHAEGIPLILVEAMYSGMFIVSSDAGGISSVISDKNGFVLSKNSSAEFFADKIKSLNKDNFNKISAWNIEYAKKYFNPEIIVEEYKKIYQDFNDDK